MEVVYKYNTQKKITRDDSEKIQSIKPIYQPDQDVLVRFHEQATELTAFASRYPESKFQVEINSIPEGTFKMIKEDIDMTTSYTDQGKRFFFCPTPNSVIIGHQEF
jgi:hypothetical protein